MIDEEWTWKFYGYHSDELSYGSMNKPIVAVCEECFKYRILKMCDYHDLCKSCVHLGRTVSLDWRNKISKALKGRVLSDEHRKKLSEANTGKTATEHTRKLLSEAATGKQHTDETKCKISESRKGHIVSDEQRKKLSDAIKGVKKPPRTEEHKRNLSRAQICKPRCTEESRQRMSASHQGIPYEEWIAYAPQGGYCEKFDEACRERIRAKYDHRCFVCDTPQDENITKNGAHRKLSVHHIDRNKNQGCDGVLWKLVPLCMSCHGKSHFDPMKSRIEYVVTIV